MRDAYYVVSTIFIVLAIVVAIDVRAIRKNSDVIAKKLRRILR